MYYAWSNKIFMLYILYVLNISLLVITFGLSLFYFDNWHHRQLYLLLLITIIIAYAFLYTNICYLAPLLVY
jgi:hypothetical protein